MSRFRPRLVPAVPFPPYAYVPGQSPHPTSDPAGHSFGVAPAKPAAIEPERWAESRAYLYGLDLFNARFYWESHVEWEGLWLAAGRHGLVADFLKGLIKLAAAGVKDRAGKPDGVKSHARRAAELWQGVARSSDAFMGFSVGDLLVLARGIAKNGWPEEPPRLIPSLDRPLGR